MERTDARVKVSAAMEIATPDQAADILKEISELDHQIDDLSLEAMDEVGRIFKRKSLEAREIDLKIKERVQVLQMFYERHRDQLLKGKAKTVKLAGFGEFGMAKGKDIFKFPKDEELVQKLPNIDRFGFSSEEIDTLYEVKVVQKRTVKVDKNSLKKFAQAVLDFLGIKKKEGQEEFFVKRDGGEAFKKFSDMCSKFGV